MQLQEFLNKLNSGNTVHTGSEVHQFMHKAAQEALSDDGYWGIKQTSDRMVSMAIALTGGDTDKADEMISAIEKGFKQATKSWGEDLPDICQKTLEETKKKMNDWKNGVTTAADYSDYLS